jgi:hypothetical protein
MRRMLLTAALLLAAATLSVVSAAEHTFVANAGNDSNAPGNKCKRATPCRNISTALTVTDPGGVLTVLDTSTHTGFTITQSVSVVANPGALALIDPPAGDAVTINAPAAAVTLRGLYLSSPGAQPQIGIGVTDVGALHVENCVIKGFSSTSIFFNTSASDSELYVTDTTISEGSLAIFISPDSSTTGTKVSIDHCRVENMLIGVEIANGPSQVMVRDSVFARNSTGLIAFPSSGVTQNVTVEGCAFTGSATGILVKGSGTPRLTLVNSTVVGSTGFGLQVPAGTPNAKVRVAHTTFSHNTKAIQRSSGTITSFGNNRQIDNGSSDAFSSTLPEV